MSAGNKPLNWSNPVFEPKRNYRFIVPFPIHIPLPKFHGQKLSDVFKTRPDLRSKKKSVHGPDCYYDMLAVSCVLPTVTTQLYRAPSIVGGFEPFRNNHPAAYDFQPVEIELIDTYSHDIQASLTAMLLGAARVKSPQGPPAQKRPTSAKALPIRNRDTDYRAAREFRITELLDDGRFGVAPGKATPPKALREGKLLPAQERAFRGRDIILYNPYISGITYGTLNYGDTELPKVKVQIVYEYIDYRYVSGRIENDQEYLRSYGREKGKIIWQEMQPPK